MGIHEQDRDLPETDGSQLAIVDSELERWRAGEIPSAFQLPRRIASDAAVADRELAARRELRCIQRRLDPRHYAVREITRVGGAATVARRVTRARGVRRRGVRGGHDRRPACRTRRRRAASRSPGGGSGADPGGDTSEPGEGVRRADDDLAAKATPADAAPSPIARAPAQFWRAVRDAIEAREAAARSRVVG